MEEESEEEAGSPFWLSESRRNRSASDILLSTRLHLAILLVIAMVFMFIVTPSLVSQTRRLFSPSSFKRRWDFLNLLLVVFAVFCGFIGKEDGEDDLENPDLARSSQNMRSGQREYNWNKYGDQGDVVRLGSLKRVNRSCPDLTRQEMSSMSAAPPSLTSPPPATASIGGRKVERGGRRVRRDDQEIRQVETRFPTPPPPPTTSMGNGKVSREEYENAVHVVRRYDQERRQAEIRPPSPPPPTPPPTTSMGKRKLSREYERGGRRVRRGDQERRRVEIRNPPLPPPLATGSSDRKGRVERDKIENLETLSRPPPSAPPLPPPFLDDKSSSSKKPNSSKKYITVPPPPKPWPAMQIGNGSESPLIPPPAPPFKVRPWKFRVRGDYVKVNSSPDNSSEGTIYTSPGNTSSESSWSRPVISRKINKTVPSFPKKSLMHIGNGSKSPLSPPPPQPPPSSKFAVGGDYNEITNRPDSSNEGTTYTEAGIGINSSSESFWSSAVRGDYFKITSSPGSSSEDTAYTAAGNMSSSSSSESFWSSAVRGDYVKITSNPGSSSEGTTYTAAGNTSSESSWSSPAVSRKKYRYQTVPPPLPLPPPKSAKQLGNKSDSPLIPPHPQPPSPRKFAVGGDYNEIGSRPNNNNEGPTYTAAGNTSSESFWSDGVRGDYVEITNSPSSSSEGTTYTAVGNTSSESLLSSPDVNTEVGDFIARLRAKLELENSNSLNRRNSQGGD